MSVTVGSLNGEDQNILEDLDLLPRDSESGQSLVATSTSPPPTAPSTSQVSRRAPEISMRHRSGAVHGIPWFEEMIEGSHLGRVGKRRRGFGGDNSVHVEWEVTEWQDSQTNVRTDDREPLIASPRTSTKRRAPEVG